MIWLLVIALLAAAGLGAYLLWDFCLRRRAGKAADDPELAKWLKGAAGESVSVTSDDELTLWGTFFPRKGARGTVLLLHGRLERWETGLFAPARHFRESGYQLLCAEQRGHGRSGGRYATYGIWERFDVRAWLHFLSWRCGEEHPVFIYGRSEGAAAALMACALDNPGSLRGVVAEGGYDLPRAYVAARLGAQGFPFPEALAAYLSGCASVLLGFGLRDYRALDAMRESACPVLLLRGGDDPFVPASDAERLREACAAGGALLTVDGAGHGECWEAGGARVRDAVEAFLERNLPKQEE